MTYSNVQLDIIRQFGSKELSEGCIVRDLYRDSQPIWKYLCDWKYFYEWNIWFIPDNEMTDWWETENIFEILWHIPELFPDVARVAKEKEMDLECFISSFTDKYCIWFTKWPRDAIQSIPYNPTLPLIDQEESTLVELLNLFK